MKFRASKALLEGHFHALIRPALVRFILQNARVRYPDRAIASCRALAGKLP